MMLALVVSACNRLSNAQAPSTALGTAQTDPSITPSNMAQDLSPTLDYSTPSPPSSKWTTFTYSVSGLSFGYPSNWYTELDEEYNRVRVSNAPPDSVISIKGEAKDFMRVDISLYPTNIGSYSSIEVYVEATVQKALPAENFISAELLPPLPQGYSAMRVTTLGLGENVTLYVANRSNFVTLQTTYVPGKQGDQKYLAVMEQIADTTTFP
jgi:hypothetical protein